MAVNRNDSEMPGPAPGRPNRETACGPCRIRSSTVACSTEVLRCTSPAAAVPVRMKMPEPITAPTPKAVRLSGPSVLRRRLPGSSEAWISASMLLVRSSWLNGPSRLALALPLHHLFDFLLQGTARHAGSALGERRPLLAGDALQFLAFGSVGNRLGVHLNCVHPLFRPAYFS